MASYICTVCGEIYDEEKEGVKFSDLPDSWSCPKCHALKGVFMPVMKTGQKGEKQYSPEDLEIDPSLVLHDEGVMDEIHRVAVTGKSIGEAMDTLMPVCGAEEIISMQEQLGTVYASREARMYVAAIAAMTRSHAVTLDRTI